MACSGLLGPSGQEVYRMVCMNCGQNYIARLVLDPVPPLSREAPALPEKSRAE